MRRLGPIFFITLLLAVAPGVQGDTISPEHLVMPGGGIGPIKPGMLLKDAVQLLGPATEISDKRFNDEFAMQAGDPYGPWYVYNALKLSRYVWNDLAVVAGYRAVKIVFGTEVGRMEDDTILLVATRDPSYRTADGLGVGSTIHVVKTVRGQVVLYAKDDTETPQPLVVPGLHMVYDAQRAIVTGLSVFCTDQGQWYCVRTSNQPLLAVPGQP